jgi:phosphoglycerate dehydrogenase-like enzyme
MSAPCIAAALSPSQITAFFPGDSGTELHSLVGNALFDPSASTLNWAAFLAKHRPEVLITHWGTPAIPEEACEHLKYVCHVTGGVRQLMPRSYMERGMRVTNWGDGAAETVAENALLLVLATLRNTQHWGREIHDRGGWKSTDMDGRSLFDRPVAIHGFGRIARTLVALMKPFRVKVRVYSAGVPEGFIRSHGAEPYASLEALCASTPDVFVELEALTPQTKGSVQEEHLRALPRGTVFVNCGRGAVVDQPALERAAVEGWLTLGLDVFVQEPLPKDSPLRGLNNVNLTPHVSGPTPDRFPALGQHALSNVQRWLKGEPLEAELTLAAYDLST